MDDKGGRGDRRQDRPHVDPEHRFECRPRHPRARAHALQHCELAYRPDRRQQTLSAAPLPHAERAARPNSCHAGDLLRRRRVVLTQLGYRRAPAARPGRGPCRPTRVDAERERAGRGSAPAFAPVVLPRRRWRLGRPRSDRRRTAFPKPTASMTASISAARSSSERTCGTGSDSPTPALSNTRTRQNVRELIEEGLEFGQGPEQLDVADERPGEDEVDGPVAEHLIREAEIAAGCVRRFRHGMSVLPPGASRTASTASCARTYDNAAPGCTPASARSAAKTSVGSRSTSVRA